MGETLSPAFLQAQRLRWPEAVPRLLRGCEAFPRRSRLPGKTVEAKSASAYLDQDHSYERTQSIVHVGGGPPRVLGLNHDDAEESSRKPLHRGPAIFS